MADGSEVGTASLQFTPTWIMAAVGSILVLISLAAERGLHQLGMTLQKKDPKSLYEALLKIKEELMLLGFIPLLLAGFQGKIERICIPAGWIHHMLPCRRADETAGQVGATNKHFVDSEIGKRLLSEAGAGAAHCQNKGKVPLLSLEATQQLDNFIFVLAITHVVFSVSIMLLGGAKINRWKQWEDGIHKDDSRSSNGHKMIFHVNEFEFINKRFMGFGIESTILSWLRSFCKQFYGSVSKTDYTTMRLGFIMAHCKGCPDFDFHSYMMRVLEADFKELVGISWYLWVFVVIFLLLNVNGWHTYFWIAFLPLFLLLAIGTKLEHVIDALAHDVAKKHTAIEGDVIVQPSDHHFWFGKPRIVLYLIHFILFQNAFEVAFFFWILITYGFDSCIMGPVRFIVPRLVIGAVIQLLCSYSTLPLYVIVTQMGSCCKKEIFNADVRQCFMGWAEMVRVRKGLKREEMIRMRTGLKVAASVADSTSSEDLIATATAKEDNEITLQTESSDNTVCDVSMLK